MENFISGFQDAFQLIITMDSEFFAIVRLSLVVSLTATLLASIFAIPFGVLLGIREFPGKWLLVRIIYTLMSMPPVVIGLVFFLLFLRSGPLGHFRLNFTPTAMIIAQFALVAPIITGVVFNGTKERGPDIQDLAKTMGASPAQTVWLLIRELRINILSAVVTGYGRAMSEVGAVMVVGGNIRGHTRIMTTTIAMLRNMGEYSLAIATGIVLLLISFAINSLLYHWQQER
ncbi:tungstate transport system permease protein [Tindallia magadiensis]|uniref:Tungstate transport system permease protein n=1 Tax=Tindallia magadiensis TaxID=69895 RepID=A0A1I3HAZ0_9FIRM|nr:ABC transporter permease [Tindallia magadiensis]SFI32905.1 tungstate transport system permease protein [Tindallia magadiensis]